MGKIDMGVFYCETDAAWKQYCDCPTDETWARYVEAKRAEDQAERKTRENSQSKSN